MGFYESGNGTPRGFGKEKEDLPRGLFEKKDDSPRGLYGKQEDSPRRLNEKKDEPPRALYKKEDEPLRALYKNQEDPPQDVCLFSRRRMELTGIVSVESFSDREIILTSTLGRVALDGENLKIESFSTERGELIVNGRIDAFAYYGSDDGKEKRGFFGRLIHPCSF